MKNIYLFSGLGADERVFQRLDFAEHKTTFVKWIEPQVEESLEQYAKRLSGQITSDNPVLIGISFGGMMAVEVAKQINPEKLILISTAKTRDEIPFYYRLAGRLQLHKLMPVKIILKNSILANWFFGVRANCDRKILSQIRNDTDLKFLKWAIDKIVHWKNRTAPKEYIHIHGSKDKILPIQFVNCTDKVDGGGHLMILSHAAKLNRILQQQLEEY